jgi:rhodanese-related sulfurtransferase
MNVISTEELKKKIDEKEAYCLIDVLSPESFEARRIPSARNVRKGPDFVERFEKEIGAAKEAEIIVYCSSETCTASGAMGALLEQAGYANVLHYRDGLAGWQRAGYPCMEGIY